MTVYDRADKWAAKMVPQWYGILGKSALRAMLRCAWMQGYFAGQRKARRKKLP